LLHQTDLDFFGMSDRGQKRPVNEDQYLIATLRRSLLIEQSDLPLNDSSRRFSSHFGKLLVVADGMGGHEQGELASSLAVYAAAQYILNALPTILPPEQMAHTPVFERELNAILEDLEETIQFHGDGQEKSMGSTLTMAYVLWPHCFVVHIGDSRCYLMRNGRLDPLTTDHTVAARLVEQGVLPEEKADQSDLDKVLWNVLGGPEQGVRPEISCHRLEPGDLLFLCSDGLTHHLDDREIARVLERDDDARTLCDTLIRTANQRGGEDNITTLVCRFSDTSKRRKRAKAKSSRDETVHAEEAAVA